MRAVRIKPKARLADRKIGGRAIAGKVGQPEGRMGQTTSVMGQTTCMYSWIADPQDAHKQINLPTNKKGCDTFETTVGKLLARRI